MSAGPLPAKRPKLSGRRDRFCDSTYSPARALPWTARPWDSVLYILEDHGFPDAPAGRAENLRQATPGPQVIHVPDDSPLHDRFRFLVRAGDALSSSLDYETTLRTVARLCVPVLADWCAVDLTTDDGRIERLIVAHVDPERERWGWEFARRYPPQPDEPRAIAAVMRTGKAELYDELTDELLQAAAYDPEHLEILRALGLSSLIIAPLTARGRTFGALTLVASGAGRRYGPEDLELAQELAARAALAVDNARLHRAEEVARHEAEGAAERAGRLLEVTARLARDLSPAEVAATIVDHGRDAMGASAGGLMLLGADGGELELLEHRGYSEAVVRSYRRLPLDAPIPQCEAVRTGKPVFLGTRAERSARYPAVESVTLQTGSCAMVALPLLANDRALGVLGLSFAEERQFTAEERAFMLTLAGQCAQALERAGTVAALQRSERRFRGVIESSLLGIGFWNAGRITDANEALLHLLGWTREELDAGAIVDELFTPPEYREADARALACYLEHGTCPPYEKELYRKGGSRVPVLVGGTLLDPEPPYEMVFFVLDLTDRRRAEARLLAAQRLEAVGRLAGGVAHEINNALQGVLGFAGFLRRDITLGTGVAEDVEEIEKAAVRAAKITQQLLAFSRRQVRRAAELDLGRVVAEFAPMMQQALGPERELVLRVPAAPALVFADRGQLEQVLLNLTLNARDAMPGAGRLTISVTPRGKRVRLEVRDTGGGMEPAVRERVFEPFFTTRGPGQGTGLGLAVVHGIVHQSGGRISVESRPGHGSVFRIELPAVGRPAGPSGRPAEPEMPAGGHETVLVADDDEGVLRFAGRTLRQAGYRVIEASDGARALELVAAEPDVALVVSDLVMPVLGGQALVERLARDLPAVRTVYMSGHAELGQASPSGQVGHPAMLEKPFGPEALLRTVREELDREPADREALDRAGSSP